MSSRSFKLIVLVATIALIFSATSVYLILDNINTKEQLTKQENRIYDLETSLEKIDALNEIIDELENSLSIQRERIDELQNTLDNVNFPNDQINIQTEQITGLQIALNEVKTDLTDATLTLNTLSNQLIVLNQSTSTELSKLHETIGNVEDVISEISGLEELFTVLNIKTPAEVYNESHKSVVLITSPVGQGSGFMFGDQNTIITNYHVVEDETNIEIQFFDRTRTQATIVGSDPYADIAVLAVSLSPSEAKPLTFSNQTVGIGQQVVAIGNPLGLTESLSVGYVSQINRLLDLEPIIVPVIQLDLTIAPGSSGGPLLDLYGNVVGITNAGTDVGFNFAVPVDIMKRVIPLLLSEGKYKHPLVGFSIIALTPEIIVDLNILNINTSQTGLLVVDVVDNSPAAKAGLTPAIVEDQGITAVDIVLAVDGHRTLTLEDWTVYVELEVSPGQTITLNLWRSGVTSSVIVTTMERPPYQ